MEVKTLDFVARLKEVEELNPSFATGLMRICYHGKNKNGSIIPKKTLEAAIPTFFNCPIVARYNRKTDKIGQHDMELVVKNGKLNLIPATQPVGVVPTNNMYFWENVEEEDGSTHEYLVMPVVLWKRQEAVAHIIEAEAVAQSMECVFDEVHEEDGETVVDKLTMQAFCLLESAKPCFESAAVDMLGGSLQEQFSLMKNDWKELCGNENFTINKINVEKGGLEVMEVENPVVEVVEPIVEKQEVIEDVAVEQPAAEEPPVEEPIEEPAVEEEHEQSAEEPAENPELPAEQDVIEHTEEIAGEPVEHDEPTAEPAAEAFAEEVPEVSVFATYETRRRALEGALPEVRRVDEDGATEYSEYYWLEDFDDNYAYVGRRIYERASGESDKRENGRFAYAISESGEAEFTGEFEPMVVRWLTVAESAGLDKERSEAAELKKWYEAYQKERVMSLCNEFANLSEVDGYEAIVEAANKGELDYDAAQEKFFALKGKYVFSLEQHEGVNKVVTVPVLTETFTGRERRYGGIIAEK